eukprot:7165393-Alexandrium_andersonii.AAC.1
MPVASGGACERLPTRCANFALNALRPWGLFGVLWVGCVCGALCAVGSVSWGSGHGRLASLMDTGSARDRRSGK